jgi:hypothetical protein
MRWPVAWESNDGFSSASGAAVAEATGEESRGEAGADGEERGSSSTGAPLKAAQGGGRGQRKLWAGTAAEMASEVVGRQGGGHGLNVVGTTVPLFGPCG